MKLTVQRRLAASLLKCSPKRVWFDNSNHEKIKEAITKADIRLLIHNGLIQERPQKGISRSRANKRLVQKRKGRQKGQGSRKGRKSARLPKKEAWINKIRLQREFLRELREKKIVEVAAYRELYRKAKAGIFRSKRHLKLYMEEHELVNKR